MIEDYLNQDGYRVNKGNWTLYNATSASTLTLTGTLPTVSFRCKVTLSATTGHTDVAGHVLINAEDLTFTVATSKTSTILLSALPTVTTSGLDCNVLIEAIDSGGAVIGLDTQTAIDCRFEPSEETVQYPIGKFVNQTGIAYTNDSSFVKGSVFSQGGYDYEVFRTKPMIDLDGSQEGLKLWLSGGTLAPSGRSVAEVCDMLKSVYDTDNDGIVDKSEGIPVLDEIPSDLSSYSDGDMFKVGTRTYIVDKPT